MKYLIALLLTGAAFSFAQTPDDYKNLNRIVLYVMQGYDDELHPLRDITLDEVCATLSLEHQEARELIALYPGLSLYYKMTEDGVIIGEIYVGIRYDGLRA